MSDEIENYFFQCFGADRLMYNLHTAHLYEYLEKMATPSMINCLFSKKWVCRQSKSLSKRV